ncbi:hypothetical protein ATANTOWER_006149 [Ataeniobius toweri]|uniref:Uncharacterized protein n=1 Tax=Ataeniobius toweri TaxID=208326 RepID=A0ABU7C6N2_9TELE|nr:hypothetical protein [Ataeniobius toweri]
MFSLFYFYQLNKDIFARAKTHCLLQSNADTHTHTHYKHICNTIKQSRLQQTMMHESMAHQAACRNVCVLLSAMQSMLSVFLNRTKADRDGSFGFKLPKDYVNGSSLRAISQLDFFLESNFRLLEFDA